MTETRIERHHYDVVVIGAGGAGLRAAIEARLAGKKTAIISKSLFGKAHTVMAEGGRRRDGQRELARQLAGALPGHHARRQVPQQLPDGRAARQEAPQRIWELETYGALFDRTKDGKISQRNFGGHEYPRLAHVGDRTGLELIRTLQQKIVSLQQEDKQEFGSYDARIRVFSETTITELLLDGDRVAGAFGYYRESGEFVLFEAPAVVLATGGVGRSYKVTSNSWEYTGDGHALALRAGRR
ncbi:FAD-binding protein [Micromonospora sp. BRA006-A]|nr:FAD-binding protein [Micromonospora sp. BRA006-A]